MSTAGIIDELDELAGLHDPNISVYGRVKATKEQLETLCRRCGLALEAAENKTTGRLVQDGLGRLGLMLASKYLEDGVDCVGTFRRSQHKAYDLASLEPTDIYEITSFYPKIEKVEARIDSNDSRYHEALVTTDMKSCYSELHTVLDLERIIMEVTMPMLAKLSKELQQKEIEDAGNEYTA